MKTSNFSNSGHYGLNGISISRWPDRRHGFIPEFTPLMPSAQLLAAYKEGMPWDSYALVYNLQLKCLNARNTWERLHEMAEAVGAVEPILICFESALSLDTKPCHRRLVAKWFEAELDVVVPEWSKADLDPNFELKERKQSTISFA